MWWFRISIVCLIVLRISPMLAQEKKHIDANGVKIHFTDEGRGEVVVLLHGFAADGDMNWRFPGVVAALAENYRVIAVDQRGHGRSDKPHQPEAYGKEMVNDVVRILDELKIENAHVVGYSMGGFVTMKLMTEHPERVISAALGGSGGIRHDFGHEWGETLAEKLDAGATFIDALQSTLSEEEKLKDEQLSALRMIFGYHDGKALAAVLRSWPQLEVSYEALQKNTIPTFFIYGSNEADRTRGYIEALKDRMGNAEFQIIEDVDHMTAVASPVLREAILKFIEDNGRR